MALHDGLDIIGIVRIYPAEGEIKGASQGIDIAADICRVAHQLLGGDRKRRALDGSGFARVGLRKLGVFGCGQAEIEHLRGKGAIPVGLEHDVCRFEIAMDQSGTMSGRQAAADLVHEENKLGHCEWLLLNDRLKRAPLEQFHHHKMPALIAAEIKHGDYVGMIERRQDTGLVPDGGFDAWVFLDPLDRNHSTQLLVPCLVNAARSAFSKGFLNKVTTTN